MTDTRMPAIHPITLGTQTFPHNLIQGPLAGISSAPFRLLNWRYSQPALSYTEMISCKTLIHHTRGILSPFLQKFPGEGPYGVQLSGTCPHELAEAVQIATDAGVNLIDLNCGCPVKKVRRRGAGSALLAQPQKLFQLIQAMKQNTHLPVSIKIRIDGDFPDQFNPDIVQVIRDSGLDFLIVHGRHWQDTYEKPCHYEQIRYFVEALSIPVIGNGDIACVRSLKNMLATGCAGVMISRAGVGQPWLIRNLVAELRGEPVRHFLPGEIGKIFYTHVLLLVRFLGNEVDALRQARKFCKYYARTLPERELFCEAMNRCETIGGLKEIVRKYFMTSIQT